MRRRFTPAVLAAVLAAPLAVLPLAAVPAAAAPARATALPARPAALPAGLSVAAVGNGMTPQQAVDEGAAEAADSQGATTYAAVVDRSTGKIVARTDNADTQVASESLVKVLLAAYYLVQHDGQLPADLSEDLHTMIVASDDALCSAYWTDKAVPAMAERYGLSGIELADDPGHWGATRVTADGMAEFLFRMSNDPEVGPWLTQAMKDSRDFGSDGFDQNFGFNALDGAASKQGWGSDNDWHEQHNAVHSIGLTKNYAAAVLQTGPSGVYHSLRPLASVTAELIADSTPPGGSGSGGGASTGTKQTTSPTTKPTGPGKGPTESSPTKPGLPPVKGSSSGSASSAPAKGSTRPPDGSGVSDWWTVAVEF